MTPSNKNFPTKLIRAEHAQSNYKHKIPPGIPLSAVLTADWWQHVRTWLRLDDVITLQAADNTFDVDVRIIALDATAGLVKFRIIREAPEQASREASVPVSPPVSPANERYVIKQTKENGWCIYEKHGPGRRIVYGLDYDGAVAEKARLEAERLAA